MFYLLITGVLFLLLLIVISIKLKTGRQRLLLWLGIFAGIPLLCFIWYKWAVWQGQKELEQAEKACAAKTSVDELTLYFTGFQRSDFSDSAQTIHRNFKGITLDSGKQEIFIDENIADGGAVRYQYNFPFATNDILEIKLGQRTYVLGQFKLRALYFGSMLGAPRIMGCVIDSAAINGKRVPFGQNMFIRKTDAF